MAGKPLPRPRPDIDIEVTAAEASMPGAELGLCLEGEFWPAIVAARRIDALEKLGIAATLQTLVGVAFAEFFPPCSYQPDQSGVPVVIVGAAQDGDLADLVAIEIEGGRAANRLGIAAVLGGDAIEQARRNKTPVRILSPFCWLREPDYTAAVIDWRRAAFALQGIDSLEFDSTRLGKRVRQAFKWPLGCPRLLVPDHGQSEREDER
jgi:hypothetical protein